MLPGNNEELAKSESKISFPGRTGKKKNRLMLSRNPDWTSWIPRRNRRDGDVDGENWICDKQGCWS